MNSDMMCFKLGIRGQDAVREEVGMDQFSLEVDAASYQPVAFHAKQEFVQQADMFGYMERRLGRSFLKGRSVLARQDWVAILEPSANSWRAFGSQVLELVEVAIFQ